MAQHSKTFLIMLTSFVKNNNTNAIEFKSQPINQIGNGIKLEPRTDQNNLSLAVVISILSQLKEVLTTSGIIGKH
jgi:hypothetical protein